MEAEVARSRLGRELVALLSNEGGSLTDAVLRILAHRFEPHGVDENHFGPFVAYESETDHFPVGPVRKHWDASALALADLGREAFESASREQMFTAARKLLVTLSCIGA